MLNDRTLIRSSFYACASILSSFCFINIHDNHRKLRKKYQQIQQIARYMQKCKVLFDSMLDKLMHIVIAQCAHRYFLNEIKVKFCILDFYLLSLGSE